MSYTYIATLGMRPEAITVALDHLREQYSYGAVLILHTSLVRPDLVEARDALRRVLRQDYPNLSARFAEIAYADGAPLADITDQTSAEAYHQGMMRMLYEAKQQSSGLHLMLAGGRKAMSVYAMLAAGRVFNPPGDRVWTVLSPEEMISKPGQFHAPPGLRGQVQLVNLPINPSRMAPGTSIETLLREPESRRASFLKKLTPAERDLAELLGRFPYHTNQQLAEIRQKSARTIENQFGFIYSKMRSFLDYGEEISDERQALRDVLRGE